MLWVFEKVGWVIDTVNALGFDIQKPTSPVTSGAAAANMGKTYGGNTNNSTANVTMNNDIRVTAPAGTNPEQVKETFQQVSQAVFSVELKKILISSGY